MKREEFKKHIRNLFYSSKTVEKYLEQAYADIDKIFDEHEQDREDWIVQGDQLVAMHKHQCEAYEAQIKSKNEEIDRLKIQLTGWSMLLDEPQDVKARSIVAMLFWEWKKQCKNCKQYNDHTFAREQKRSEAYYCFKKAYAILKATT